MTRLAFPPDARTPRAFFVQASEVLQFVKNPPLRTVRRIRGAEFTQTPPDHDHDTVDREPVRLLPDQRRVQSPRRSPGKFLSSRRSLGAHYRECLTRRDLERLRQHV